MLETFNRSTSSDFEQPEEFLNLMDTVQHRPSLDALDPSSLPLSPVTTTCTNNNNNSSSNNKSSARTSFSNSARKGFERPDGFLGTPVKAKRGWKAKRVIDSDSPLLDSGIEAIEAVADIGDTPSGTHTQEANTMSATPTSHNSNIVNISAPSPTMESVSSSSSDIADADAAAAAATIKASHRPPRPNSRMSSLDQDPNDIQVSPTPPAGNSNKLRNKVESLTHPTTPLTEALSWSSSPTSSSTSSEGRRRRKSSTLPKNVSPLPLSPDLSPATGSTSTNTNISTSMSATGTKKRWSMAKVDQALVPPAFRASFNNSKLKPPLTPKPAANASIAGKSTVTVTVPQPSNSPNQHRIKPKRRRPAKLKSTWPPTTAKADAIPTTMTQRRVGEIVKPQTPVKLVATTIEQEMKMQQLVDATIDSNIDSSKIHKSSPKVATHVDARNAKKAALRQASFRIRHNGPTLLPVEKIYQTDEVDFDPEQLDSRFLAGNQLHDQPPMRPSRHRQGDWSVVSDDKHKQGLDELDDDDNGDQSHLNQEEVEQEGDRNIKDEGDIYYKDLGDIDAAATDNADAESLQSDHQSHDFNRPDIWVTPMEGTDPTKRTWRVKRVWGIPHLDELEVEHEVDDADLFDEVRALLGVPLDGRAMSQSMEQWHVKKVYDVDGIIDESEPETAMGDTDLRQGLEMLSEEVGATDWDDSVNPIQQLEEPADVVGYIVSHGGIYGTNDAKEGANSLHGHRAFGRPDDWVSPQENRIKKKLNNRGWKVKKVWDAKEKTDPIESDKVEPTPSAPDDEDDDQSIGMKDLMLEDSPNNNNNNSNTGGSSTTLVESITASASSLQTDEGDGKKTSEKRGKRKSKRKSSIADLLSPPPVFEMSFSS